MTRAFVLVLVLVFAGCASTPPLQPGTGGVTGRVTAKPHEGARKPNIDPYDPYQRDPAAKFARIDYDKLEDIVVWLAPRPAGPGSLPEVLTLEESGFRRPLAVGLAGHGLGIMNETGRPATFFSVAEGAEFEVKVGAHALGATLPLARLGLVAVGVDERPDVAAEVLLIPADGFRRLRSGEPFTFAGLAPGDYTLTAWHARLPPRETRLHVAAGAYTTVDLEIGVDAGK